jgi:hypothetical protein
MREMKFRAKKAFDRGLQYFGNDRVRTFIKCVFVIILIGGAGIGLSAYIFGLPGLYTSGFVIGLMALISLIVLFMVLFEDFCKRVWKLLKALASTAFWIGASTGVFGVVGLSFGLSWKDSIIVALILEVVVFLSALAIGWIIDSPSEQNPSSEPEGQASVKESEC